MIIANFTGNKNRISVGGACQYDYGQVLRIQGLSLPANVEVHFSLNETFGESVRRIGATKDGVTEVVIPDSMFEGDGTQVDQYYYFYVFIYLSDETSGETEYFINVQTKCRPRPADFAPPDNPDFTGEVIEKLNDLEASKLSKPSTAEVGQMLRVKSINDDGTYDIEGSDISFGEEAKEEIKKAVSSYIEENPIEETDPTVPEWAKQPNKPTYTAEEVGALSKDIEIPSMDDVNENTRVRHEHNNKEALDEINEQSVQKWDRAYSHSTSVHAPENAQENIIEDIRVNGSSLDVTDKSVEISVPTKTSDIENDSGFLVSPANAQVGKFLKVTSVNEDGTFLCSWADVSAGDSQRLICKKTFSSMIFQPTELDVTTGIFTCLDHGIRIGNSILVTQFMNGISILPSNFIPNIGRFFYIVIIDKDTFKITDTSGIDWDFDSDENVQNIANNIDKFHFTKVDYQIKNEFSKEEMELIKAEDSFRVIVQFRGITASWYFFEILGVTESGGGIGANYSTAYSFGYNVGDMSGGALFDCVYRKQDNGYILTRTGWRIKNDGSTLNSQNIVQFIKDLTNDCKFFSSGHKLQVIDAGATVEVWRV